MRAQEYVLRARARAKRTLGEHPFLRSIAGTTVQMMGLGHFERRRIRVEALTGAIAVTVRSGVCRVGLVGTLRAFRYVAFLKECHLHCW